MYSIEVKTGDEWHLGFVMRFSFYDRGDDSHFYGRESERVSFVSACIIPEGVIFAQHALEELVWRSIPIHLIGIRNEETFAGFAVEPVLRKILVAIE